MKTTFGRLNLSITENLAFGEGCKDVLGKAEIIFLFLLVSE